MRYDFGEVITAMVTPFDNGGGVDYTKVEELSDYLSENGSDSIIVTGTTGESPTLIYDEELEILNSAKRAVRNGKKVIMGTGSNCTETAVMMSKKAEKEGADGILTVVPYYNKPSQKGMIAHFSAVAEAVNIPVILYNIPSRTGVSMSVETARQLCEKYENIVAIKQSFGDMDTITEFKLNLPKGVAVYSGDDSLTLPMLSVGAHGVISVASHLFGKEIKSMIRNFKTGDITTAMNMHYKLYPIMKKLFMAPNPVPVKAALARKGLIEEFVRSPLVTLDAEEKLELFSVLDKMDEQEDN
ncbi:MAG: 4-hydroxy-tetrahydrodipicolinate synthase [Candidatus Gastranaerophilales bacterium]|nr:4-hydroxy-tetrahydrodipicolinate synthase [Candidatus Gastranaerophilales bacterium]